MSSTTFTVNVSGIAQTTTKQNLHDFFTFCGKITKIDFSDIKGVKTAVIHFEKPSAAKTALMLNSGTLDGANLTVTSDIAHEDIIEESDRPIDQSEKPRAAIVAEYLAKGYVLRDDILQRAIDLDVKQGISTRFLGYINNLDTKIGARALGPDQTISGKLQEHMNTAVSKAKEVDEKQGITKTATDLYTKAIHTPVTTGIAKAKEVDEKQGLTKTATEYYTKAIHTPVTTGISKAKEVDEKQGLSRAATEYYSKALASPLSKKVLEFYTTTSKQVMDIHEEAKRIAAEQKASTLLEPTTPTLTTTAPVVSPALKQAPMVGVKAVGVPKTA